MEPQTRLLKDGRQFLIREAAGPDARTVLAYLETVSGESDFLTFGPGEFDYSEAEEVAILENFQAATNQLFLLGLVAGELASILSFSGGRRPRVRHSGDLAITVRRDYWGLGAGGHMIDALLNWARQGGTITKINLQVRSDNGRAIRLYEKKGFYREGTIHQGIFVNGRYYDNYWMGLEL